MKIESMLQSLVVSPSYLNLLGNTYENKNQYLN